MDAASRIYVAGHRGLVGSAFVRELEGKGYGNLLFRRSGELDLRRQEDTESFFAAERPEYVFLAAAKVGGILANDTYRAEFIYDNLFIAANIIHSSYKYGVGKLLNLGSSCIYPRAAGQPMKEEYLLTGALEPTNEPYAIAKIAAIKLSRYYNEQYGTDFMSVMPTNLYGPGDNFNLETSHVLAALIRKFHLARLLRDKDFEGIRKDIQKYPLGFGLDKEVDAGDEGSMRRAVEGLGVTGDSVTIWGSGEPRREFLYVDDLAGACVYLMENYGCSDTGEFVNIGTGEDIRIKDMAEIIRETAGFEGEIRFDRTKPDGTSRKLLDVSRMKSLGWEHGTGLRAGIKKTYEWYAGTLQKEGVKAERESPGL